MICTSLKICSSITFSAENNTSLLQIIVRCFLKSTDSVDEAMILIKQFPIMSDYSGWLIWCWCLQTSNSFIKCLPFGSHKHCIVIWFAKRIGISCFEIVQCVYITLHTMNLWTKIECQFLSVIWVIYEIVIIHADARIHANHNCSSRNWEQF